MIAFAIKFLISLKYSQTNQKRQFQAVNG